MFRSTVVALLVAIVTVPGMAADPVPGQGTSVTYAPAVSANVKDKAVQLNLTGVGLRTKVGFDVYTVASYVQDGTRVRGAEDVAKVDAVRLLHLVMQRHGAARRLHRGVPDGGWQVALGGQVRGGVLHPTG